MKRIAALLALALAFGLPHAPAWSGTSAPIAEDRVDWQAHPVRLLMVTRVGCIYCAAWDREIAPGFAASSEGRAAPLLRVDIDGPWPDGIALARRPTITPTFVVLRNGAEAARLEGYPGENFFYAVLDEIMEDAGVFADKKETQ